MAKKVVSIRIDPKKLKILEEAGISKADFFRRSLEVFEEQWRLKNYQKSVELGKALEVKVKIDSLEAEQQIIKKKLKEVQERLRQVKEALPFPSTYYAFVTWERSYPVVKWVLENALKKDIDPTQLISKVRGLDKVFFDGKTFINYYYEIYKEEGYEVELIQRVADRKKTEWTKLIKNFEKLRPTLLFYESLEKQFKKILEMNQAKITKCQNEYLQSLMTEQIKKACSEINV